MAKKESLAGQARRYRKKHPDKVAAIKKRYREKNVDVIRETDRLRAEQRRKADPEGARRRQLEYQERQRRLKEERAGRPRPSLCELCGGEGRIVYDHCHDCGAFRGWLCDRCNKVLGLVRESPVLLTRLADYIQFERMKEVHRGEAHSEAPQEPAEVIVWAAGAKGFPDARPPARGQREGSGEADVETGQALPQLLQQDRRQGEPQARQEHDPALD